MTWFELARGASRQENAGADQLAARGDFVFAVLDFTAGRSEVSCW